MRYTYFLIFMFLLLANFMRSQVDTTGLPSENVEVIKAFKAKFEDIKMKKVYPRQDKEALPPILYTYSISEAPMIEFEKQEPIVRPVYFRENKQKTIKNGLVRLGYGNFRAPLAEASYNYFVPDWFEIGVKAFHSSFDNSSIENQKASDTRAELYGGYFLKPKIKVTLSTFGNWKRRHFFHSYLMDAQFQDPPHSIDQYGANAGLVISDYEDKGLSAKLNIGAVRDELKEYNASLQTISVRGSVRKNLSSDWRLALPFEMNLYKRNYSDVKRSFHLLNARPSLAYNSNKISMDAGLSFFQSSDHTRIFPQIDVKYTVLQSLYLSAEVRQKNHWNTMATLLGQNPWWFDEQPETLARQNTFSLGLHYVDKTVSVSLKGSFIQTENEVLFANNDDIVRFTSITGDRDRWDITLKSSYHPLKWVKASGSYTYMINANNSFQDVYYNPHHKLKVRLSQELLKGTVKLYQAVEFRSASEYLAPDGITSAIDGFYDCATGFDIKINDTFSIFGDVYNIFNVKYALWYDLPVLERQIQGGVKAVF